MYTYLITRQGRDGRDEYDLYASETLYKRGDKVTWDYEEWFIDDIFGKSGETSDGDVTDS